MIARTLLDGVEGLFLGDLKLGVGPTRNLDNHCERSASTVSPSVDVLFRIVLASSAKRGMSLTKV
jgi:hypothetical protein